MEHIMIGLPNLGNTCFINSCIQAILSSSGILNEIRTRDVAGDIDKRVQRVVFSERGLPIQSEEICCLLMNIYDRDNPGYEIGENQDCSEFLTYYFNYLKTTDQKITIETTMRNSKETSVTECTEDILFLPIPKKNGTITFYDCFDEYKSTTFEAENGETGTVDYKIKHTGKQIFIGLKRFSGVLYRGRYISRKIYTPVEMDEEITIPVGDENKNYTLKSIILHIGELAGGHYITYRKMNNVWFYADDMNIGELKKGKFNMGYIYVYECMD